MPYDDDMMHPRCEEVETVKVPKAKIEKILRAARVGEEQVVPYSREPGLMADRAAELSRLKCGEVIQMCLEILAGD